MDAYYVPGGRPYSSTKKLKLAALPFESKLTIWTDPERPSALAIKGALELVNATDAFRTEVENRFFEQYTQCTRDEYLEYVNDPDYDVTADMLPAITQPIEIWSIFHPVEYSASINEPTEMYPSEVAEVVLSFSVAFD